MSDSCAASPTPQALTRDEAGWVAIGLGLTACRSAESLSMPAWSPSLSRSERSVLAAAGALSALSLVLLIGA